MGEIGNHLGETPRFRYMNGAFGMLGVAGSISDAGIARGLRMGDPDAVGRGFMQLGIDGGTAMQGLGEFAQLSRVAEGLPEAAGLSRLIMLGRGVGIAGSVASIGFGAYDLWRGGENTVPGLCNVAQGVGMGMGFIWGASSWLGPIGWGIAGLATAVSWGWTHTQATKLADPAFTIR
ncbi:MAG: hypothetical protein ACYCW6_12605 [Candidatus Xenobia bacterium]